AHRAGWVSMPPDPIDRTYHSMAMLLPDGRVLAAGSNTDGQATLEDPDGKTYTATAFDTRISIYTPAYLLRGGGGLPALTVKKHGWDYGKWQEIGSDQKVKSAYL